MEFNWCEQVYKVVKRIPRGKVSNYGNISEYINEKTKKLKNRKISPQSVGYALHQNPDPENIPCHRVVNAKGELAKNYAFGGAKAQKEKLLKEKIVFKDELRVDLGKCLFTFKGTTLKGWDLSFPA